jgi:hypothetical protein
MIKISITDFFFGILETRNTANTSPIDLFFFLNNLNFLLSKSRFYTSSNTTLFVYKLKNAALHRLASRQSMSGKRISYNRISQTTQKICLQEGKIFQILPKLGQTNNSAVCSFSVLENTIRK